MTALRRLRVFQCRQGLPITLQNTMTLHRSRRIALKFERAMFPKGVPSLPRYELYVDTGTRVDMFDAVSPTSIVAIRFSGAIVVQTDRREVEAIRMPALRHVVLHGVTGNFLDRHTIEECFPAARLESFTYVLGHPLAFEIRDKHLESLTLHGPHLRKLILLGCSRLSSAVITRSLESFPALEYFALHIVTVTELRSNFVHGLLQSLTVLKLQVMNAPYASPLLAEERGLCEAIESGVLHRDRPFKFVCLCFRDIIITEGGRQDRWRLIAEDRKFELHIGPWEDQMVENT